ncbi:MAG: glycerol-3-phosphate 1-O-acyltransferase PlsY [Christensenellales bacterium]|jgi:glycerol-3-phosphate acyltransferase PlsY
MTALKIIAIVIIGYFLGSIQFGLLICRHFGLDDIRKVGSGGTGATNVMRTLGKLPSALTLLLDALKGAVATLAGLWLLGENGAYIGGVAALIGHIWPVYYGFKGGKGAATTIGSLIAVQPAVGLVFFVVAIAGIAVLKVVSIVSIALATVLLIYILLFHIQNAGFVVYGVVVFALIVYCHRGNIRRIISGDEFTRKVDIFGKGK